MTGDHICKYVVYLSKRIMHILAFLVLTYCLLRLKRRCYLYLIGRIREVVYLDICFIGDVCASVETDKSLIGSSFSYLSAELYSYIIAADALYIITGKAYLKSICISAYGCLTCDIRPLSPVGKCYGVRVCFFTAFGNLHGKYLHVTLAVVACKCKHTLKLICDLDGGSILRHLLVDSVEECIRSVYKCLLVFVELTLFCKGDVLLGFLGFFRHILEECSLMTACRNNACFFLIGRFKLIVFLVSLDHFIIKICRYACDLDYLAGLNLYYYIAIFVKVIIGGLFAIDEESLLNIAFFSYKLSCINRCLDRISAFFSRILRSSEFHCKCEFLILVAAACYHLHDIQFAGRNDYRLIYEFRIHDVA